MLSTLDLQIAPLVAAARARTGRHIGSVVVKGGRAFVERHPRGRTFDYVEISGHFANADGIAPVAAFLESLK